MKWHPNPFLQSWEATQADADAHIQYSQRGRRAGDNSRNFVGAPRPSRIHPLHKQKFLSGKRVPNMSFPKKSLSSFYTVYVCVIPPRVLKGFSSTVHIILPTASLGEVGQEEEETRKFRLMSCCIPSSSSQHEWRPLI